MGHPFKKSEHSNNTRRPDCILRSDQKRCVNYFHGEIVVVGDGEIGKLAQVHVPSSDSIHNEDVRRETQGTTCRLGVEKQLLVKLDQYCDSINTDSVNCKL